MILSIVSIFITFVILESKQKRDIDLLIQKEVLHNEFDKKETLLDFSSKIKTRVEGEITEINKTLQEHTYKIIGSLSNNHIISKFDSIVEFLEEYEESNGIDIVLFEENDLNIIYGHQRILFLSKLIFGKYNDTYKDIVLKYISSQGRYNLQEWKNDLTGALRLSFFDLLEIDGKRFYIGTFSKVENIRFITKKT